MVDVNWIVFFLSIWMFCSFIEISKSGLKTILVPTDFSESSNVALRVAINLAKEQNARIHLLHVFPFRQVADEMELMQQQLAKFPEAQPVEIVPEIRKGKIHEEILKAQKEIDVDLIVIARRRKTRSVYTFFRSVTERVKRKAHCSVLVVGA